MSGPDAESVASGPAASRLSTASPATVLLAVWATSNLLLVIAHSRFGQVLGLPWLGFRDPLRLAGWGAGAVILPLLAWTARGRGWGQLLRGWVRGLGIPTSFEAAFEPRPRARPSRVLARVAVGAGLLALGGLSGPAFLLGRVTLLVGALLLAPAGLGLLGVRWRLRPRVAFRSAALGVTLLLAFDLVNLLLFVAPLVEEASLFQPNPVTGIQNTAGYRSADITIDDFGFRCPGQDARSLSGEQFVVLLLGGSTAFGWCLPDRDSLGPLLEASLRSRGVAHPRVLNPSTAGWYSWNEVCYYLCETPRWPVDVAVFLHGRNDLYYGWTAQLRSNPSESRAGPHVSRLALKRDRGDVLRGQSLIGRLFGPVIESGVPDPADDRDARARNIAGVYAGNMRIAAAVARDRRLPTLDVLQPCPYSGRDLLESERSHLEIDLGESRGYWEALPLLRATAAALPEHEYFRSLDLVDALERGACPGEAYFDECHYTAAANRVLAERLADAISAWGTVERR